MRERKQWCLYKVSLIVLRVLDKVSLIISPDLPVTRGRFVGLTPTEVIVLGRVLATCQLFCTVDNVNLPCQQFSNFTLRFLWNS